MARHINVPVFIPHLGCPNQCVFCNQRTISGTEHFDPDGVRDIIEEALSTAAPDDECEIAFFGGSFTGIDRALMLRLLSISDEFYDAGRISSVRCSTRPDYIDDEILDILAEHHVETVELGLQSTCDDVLSASRRGHTRDDEERACRLITARGFSLVGQMMIGLPDSTLEKELETARFIIESGAVGARIYPTVVFKDTPLCTLAECGEYAPLSVDDAVERSASVLSLFVDAGIPVIRIGLCSSENLSSEDKYFAGPNHPALGELVESRLYLKRITEKIESGEIRPSSVRIHIPRGATSKAIGQKRENKRRLREHFGFDRLTFIEEESLPEYNVEISEERKEDNVFKIT